VTPTPQSTATTTNARTHGQTVKGTALRARSYFDYNGALQSAEHERTLNHLTTLNIVVSYVIFWSLWFSIV